MTSPTSAFELEDLFHTNMSAHALEVFNAIEEGATSRPDIVVSTNMSPVAIRQALAELIELRMVVCTGSNYKLAKRLQGDGSIADAPKGTADNWLALFNRLSGHLPQDSQMIHAVLLAALKDSPTRPANFQLSCGEDLISNTMGTLFRLDLVEVNSRGQYKLSGSGKTLFEGLDFDRGAWQTLFDTAMSSFTLSRIRTELGVLVAGPASTTRLSKKVGLEPEALESSMMGLVAQRRVQTAGESTPVKYKLCESARRDWEAAVSRVSFTR